MADPLSLGLKGLTEVAPHNKLLTTLCNAMGAKAATGGPVTKFGTYGEAGEFEEIKA